MSQHERVNVDVKPIGQLYFKEQTTENFFTFTEEPVEDIEESEFDQSENADAISAHEIMNWWL